MNNDKQNELFEKMMADSQRLTNDDLIAASSAIDNVVHKITNGEQWDLKDALSDDAIALQKSFEELAKTAQTYTDEYNAQDYEIGSADNLPDEVYESKTDNTYDINDKIQKILNKLISEETIAHDFYVACTMAATKEVAREFSKMFISTAVDEMDDHCRALAQWAHDNGYSVPFKYKDYKKHANSKVFKQLDDLKQGKDAKYYVDEAIKSENDAITSYEEAMKYDGLPYELHSICMKNYYDEQQHLDDLQTLATAIDANTHLTWY